MSPLSLACFLALAGHVFMAAIPENQVEVYFVMDQAAVTKYLTQSGGDEAAARAIIDQDIDYFISEINKLFEKVTDLSIGVMKRGFQILDTDILQGPEVERDAGLKTFDEWRKAQGLFDKYAYDVAVLWTGFELVRDGNPSTAGYANVGKVCDSTMASLIAEYDLTYNTVVVTAHEIGHCLGSSHDSDSLRRVMGAEAYAGSENRWSFSSESSAEIKTNVGSLSTNCLLVTSPESKYVDAAIPKDITDPDHICQRAENNKESYMIKSQTYYEMQPPHGDSICRAIFCYNGEPDSSVAAYASDGMVCAKNKRCKEGLCVDSPDAESGAVPSDDCVFSDQTSIDIAGFKGTCTELITSFGARVCYYYSSMCCTACSAHATADPDCLYGDKSSKCEGKEQWQVCGGSASTCCGLCKGYAGKRSAPENGTQQVQPDLPPESNMKKTEMLKPMDD
ncbi:hypothetical protein EGW08_011371 [Elysia chlorotica]|uniref:Peptidase M12B domain-containing protein n=2 Tax=Elysia chlorotica TaxID=188477 RepID=A0A433TGX1_ELYCH|nr:hypothetical protein EGW08_011371 [Elysia chlorotica]